jgi:hypothetical protein
MSLDTGDNDINSPSRALQYYLLPSALPFQEGPKVGLAMARRLESTLLTARYLSPFYP